MKEELYIFGAGGFAKETYYLASDLYDVKAFIDRDKDATNEILSGKTIPIISEDDFSTICATQKVNAAIAIANNHVVSSIYEKFAERCSFPNIIHSSAQLLDIKIEGIGNLIAHRNYLSYNVRLGSFNRITIGSIIGHDCKIGDYNQINPHCTISGNTEIGNHNLFGAGSTLLQGINVGNNNILGLGAVFLTSIKDNGVYIGNPARLMAKNTK